MSRQDDTATPNTPLRGAWWLTLPLLAVSLLVFTAADRDADSVPCRAIDIEVDQLDGMYFVDAPSLRNAIVQQFTLLDQPMAELPHADCTRPSSITTAWPPARSCPPLAAP